MTTIHPANGNPVVQGSFVEGGPGNETGRKALSFADMLATLLDRESGQRDPQSDKTEPMTLSSADFETHSRDDAMPRHPRMTPIPAKWSFFFEHRAGLDDSLSAVARQMAEIFNEFGLLRSHAALVAPDAADVGRENGTVSAGWPAPSETAGADARPSTIEAIGARMPPDAGDSRGDRTGALRAETAGPPRSAGLQRTASGTSAGPDPALASTEETEPDTASADAQEPQRARVERAPWGRHSSDALVILEMAEQGIRLAARAARLSEEDRFRLRQAIAALLASHGFRPAEIRLNGDAGSPSRHMHEGEA